MTFRPYPGFTIATAILFVLLCGLGVWQVQRLHWKLDLIATMTSRMHAAPVAADALAPLPGNEYRRVTLGGRFDHAREAYVFTTAGGGEGVYHVLTPFRTDAGHLFLVDRGMVDKAHLDPATRRGGSPEGETRLTGIWRTPDKPGFFTPAPDRPHRIWYARDLAAIAAADRITLSAPVVIEADATPDAGGWPKGGQTVVDLPNNHLSYAITWFGLAAALLGVWLAYHIRHGRLAWRKG